MFLPRSVVGNLRDGVVMELDRLRARHLPFFCLHNRCAVVLPVPWQRLLARDIGALLCSQAMQLTRLHKPIRIGNSMCAGTCRGGLFLS